MLLIILCFFISVTCVTDESKKLIKECQEEKDSEQNNAREEPTVCSLNLGHLSGFDINEDN